MTVEGFGAEPPDPLAVRRRVNGLLTDFLDRKARSAALRRMPEEVTGTLRDFLTLGGKRVRPLLCVLGWHAAGGRGETGPLLATAASLEMFHAFALIHDDIMDASATRRGRPTVHRQLAARFRERGAAEAERLGVNTAILLGDLALVWSDEMLHGAGLAPGPLHEVLALSDRMRAEVMYGQYLDLSSGGGPADDLEHALRIARYKTATYTIERPLHIGAAIAGASPDLRAALTAYALPLGEAFQLRDDLLGTFGRPEVTGKAVVDDVREAKATALLTLALERADASQAEVLRGLVGRQDLEERDVAELRSVLEATGARDAVEEMISDRHRAALAALDRSGIDDAATTELLRSLAHSVVTRTS